MVPYLAVLLSALLLWAAFPPLDLGPLAFVAPIPFFWAIRRVERGPDAVALGFLWGSVFFGGLLYWISVLGFIAWFPLTIALGAYFAAYGFIVWSFRLWPAWRWWLIAIGAWVGMEFIRARFPFGGFPWGNIGYSAAGFSPLLGTVQWVGPVGWSMLAIALSAGVVLMFEDRVHNWRFVVDPAVVILLLAIAGSLFAPSADGTPMRVAIVQGNSPCPMVHCQNENRRIYESHLRLTETIPDGGADLVVWPENATGTPYEPGGNDAVQGAIIEQASRIGAYFLVSGTRIVEPDSFVNVNVLYSPDGIKLGEYWKRHPVPYGEYVPLRGLLGFIPQLDQVPRDMISGTEPVVFQIGEDGLGSVISFEGAFARSIQSIAANGAQMMVVSTNESSFGETAASDQLIDMTRVNAAAIGQDLVHAAITGRSTFITADGSVGEKTALYEEAVLFGDLAMRSAGPTLLTRFPYWPLVLALGFALIGLFWPGEGGIEDVVGRRRAGRRES
ncbi:MAG: apolipoprotein N-acyltransferase [Acidobacteria bacterium]|nr:apolipoprotein N-acyltransferase [Acidobacteriota bacterium]